MEYRLISSLASIAKMEDNLSVISKSSSQKDSIND